MDKVPCQGNIINAFLSDYLKIVIPVRQLADGGGGRSGIQWILGSSVFTSWRNYRGTASVCHYIPAKETKDYLLTSLHFVC